MDNQTASPRTSVPLPKSKRGMKGFISEVGRELKKVTWPTRTETNRLTGVVMAVSLMLILLLTILNYGFRAALDVLLGGF